MWKNVFLFPDWSVRQQVGQYAMSPPGVIRFKWIMITEALNNLIAVMD